jgi:hypothetical protein
VKSALKIKRFQDIEDMKKNVTVELNAVSLEAFAGCFQTLFERSNNVFKWVEVTFKKIFICLYFFIYFFTPRIIEKNGHLL